MDYGAKHNLISVIVALLIENAAGERPHSKMTVIVPVSEAVLDWLLSKKHLAAKNARMMPLLSMPSNRVRFAPVRQGDGWSHAAAFDSLWAAAAGRLA
jgi:hypothetical protein